MCCCLFMFVISCNDLLLLGCYYLSLFVAMCYYLLLFVAIRCYLLPFVAICFYLLIFVWAKCTYSTLQLQPTRHLYTFRRKLNVYFKTPVAKPWVASILISRHMVKYSAWEIEKKHMNVFTMRCLLTRCLRGFSSFQQNTHLQNNSKKNKVLLTRCRPDNSSAASKQ